MVCSTFLPSIEKVSQETQLLSFEKSNLEKRHCKNQGFSGYN